MCSRGCGSSFDSPAAEKMHVDGVHDVMKAWGCRHCHATFTQKGILKRHVEEQHLGFKHACDICAATFTQKGNLKTHVEEKHLGFKHACDICAATFTKKGNLKRHVLAKHSGC